MAATEIQCAYCGEFSYKENGAINRAVKHSKKLYCSKVCSGAGRRKNQSQEELREKKRLYDAEYRQNNSEVIKKKKSDWFQSSYDPVLASIRRKQVKQEKPELEEKRLQYMASPEYKLSKKKYDRKYKAVQKYGEEWAECAVLTLDIRDECLSKLTAYEIRLNAGTLNKSQHRKRDYERLNSKNIESGPLGYIERP